MAAYASAHSATTPEPATDTQTATAGLRKRGDTWASHFDAGRPLSRAKANSMRELDVTEDRPQNHMAPMATHTSAPPSAGPRACVSTYRNGLAAAAVVGKSWMASVTAPRSR